MDKNAQVGSTPFFSLRPGILDRVSVIVDRSSWIDDRGSMIMDRSLWIDDPGSVSGVARGRAIAPPFWRGGEDTAHKNNLVGVASLGRF